MAPNVDRATGPTRRRDDPVLVTSWKDRTDVGHVVLGVDGVTTPSRVQEILTAGRSRGFRTLLTCAMSSRQAVPFLDAGFQVRERLHLLERPLHHEPEAPPHHGAPHAVRRGRRADRSGVQAIDQLAFDGFWRLGRTGLLDALRATPIACLRVGRRDDGVCAYALSGAAGRTGYLQRVAVHPDARHLGWGHALVADALAWMWAEGARRAYVNTQLTNVAAYTLYRSAGFEPCPDGLVVLECAR